MSEIKPIYRTATDETQEAMEMLGKGYEHPSVTITPPHTTIERRGNEFKEIIVPAFVKISTGFKSELAGIDEIALKVWLFIALSVNRYSGKANPGLRTIADGTGFAINTVRAAVIRLESQYNLLTVDRKSRKYNIYEPVAFVSANRIDPPVYGVSPDDTVDQSVSLEPQSVSAKPQSVSPWVILNQRNQIKPESTTTKENFSKIFTAYENEIGMITPHVRDAIGDYLDDLKISPDWMIDSFHIAAEHNKRNWAYCAAILKRWAVEGKTALPPRATPSGPKYPIPKGSREQFLKNLEKN